MTAIRGNGLGVPNLGSISADLFARGYTHNEIDFALSWLFEKTGGSLEQLGSIGAPSSSYRLLDPAERMVIRPGAYGYLLQLKELRLLSDPQLELAIESAMTAGVESIDEEDIKEIAASVIFETDSIDGGYSGDNWLAH